ncbi:hypothetical protein U9M48_020884 [Paspalum notatum var. saurae]|uniref:Uncharacterized protein n=1 Tax=Paspalum notatum var. saurae TaxID=547442 RepID=A0AAQ3TEC3_PASNO
MESGLEFLEGFVVGLVQRHGCLEDVSVRQSSVRWDVDCRASETKCGSEVEWSVTHFCSHWSPPTARLEMTGGSQQPTAESECAPSSIPGQLLGS